MPDLADPNTQDLASGLPEGVELARYVNDIALAKAAGTSPPPMSLDQLFRGEQFAGVREQVRKDGVAEVLGRDGVSFIGVDLDGQGNVMAVAAGVPRTPSRAQDFLKDVVDFKPTADPSLTRTITVPLFNRIYRNEGLLNNAVNKVTALVATGVTFKVRRMKGTRGKGGDKRAAEFLAILKYWAENVNSPGPNNAVTGARGMKAFIAQGVRQALIEGDHFARTTWVDTPVPTLGGKTFSIPMNIQSFAGETIKIPTEAAALGLDWIEWHPTGATLNAITNPADKDLGKEIKKLIPSDVANSLKKLGYYRLDSSLMAHIRHRPVGSQPYGESFVVSAMSSIAYKRALQALDIVTIENLINRLVVLKIGDSNPASAYHSAQVSSTRIKMLESMMRRIGPSSTILWAGPDLDVVEVGAHNAILDLDGRYQTARSMLREDLGTPAALLTGEGADGKASALTAIIAVAAQMEELQNQYVETLRTWAQRIGTVNGYEDVDVDCIFAANSLINKTERTASLLMGYQAGAVPLEVLLEDGYGLDYEACQQMMDDEVAAGYREVAFGAPGFMVSTNPTGTANGGGGAGRPPASQRPGKTDPRTNTEKGIPSPNQPKEDGGTPA